MAMLSNPISGPAAGSSTLAATGLASGISELLWLAVAVIVIGGTITTFAKLGPRVAFEPTRMTDGSHRWRLTYNGRRVGRR